MKGRILLLVFAAHFAAGDALDDAVGQWSKKISSHLAADEIAHVITLIAAATLVLKLDPDYMQLSIGPALQDTLLNNYVLEQGKTVYAGFRSVAHDTNTHDFLLNLGYSRVYCDLKVVYRPAVAVCVNLLYGCRSLVDRAPESSVKRNIRGLLTQEEIRRSIELDGNRAIRPTLLERIARSVRGNRYGTTEK